MTSVFEKITLYDFFCYLIPGMIFESLVGLVYIAFMLDSNSDLYELLSDGGTFPVILFLLFGYVGGVLISEIARKVADEIDTEDGLYKEVAQEIGCSTKTLRDALVRSHLLNQSDVKDVDAPQLIKNNMRLMRALIQIDQKYKRMHDYSSFSTMCKNLSASFLLAGVVNEFSVAGVAWRYLSLNCSEMIAVTGAVGITVASVIPFAVVAAILWNRFCRFELKQAKYTVIWFVDKEMNNESNSNGQGTGNNAE